MRIFMKTQEQCVGVRCSVGFENKVQGISSSETIYSFGVQ